MSSLKKLFFTLLSTAVLLSLSAALSSAQEIERVINMVLNGQKMNAQVVVYGVVEQWNLDKAKNTIAFIVKDDWGDKITILGTGEHPETHKRYKVVGYVAYDQANQEYQLMETARELLDVPPPIPHQMPSQMPSQMPTPEPQQGLRINWIIVVLAAAVLLVFVALLFVIFKSRNSGESVTTDFGSDAIISVADKTQKITAAVADQAAVDAGTVKVMPGRFEVQGGTDLKEIRLIRPKGVNDQNIEYTFGRSAGDKITHIQLNDQTVSSSQARLKFNSGKYLFVNIPDPNDPDRNASILNGQKMNTAETKELIAGDKIQMGHTILTYQEI